MKNVTSTIVSLLFITVILAPIVAQPASAREPAQVIVGFREANSSEARRIIEAYGGTVKLDLGAIRAVSAQIPAGAMARLSGDSRIAYVELDHPRFLASHILPLQIFTGTPEILPWGVDKVDADAVWDADNDLVVDAGAVAGQGVRVAVLDTGFNYTHPDLAANMVPLSDYCLDVCDFLDNDSDPRDIPGPVTGHGTLTSGNIAAVDNDIGVIGVAPHAKILGYRVCDSALNSCPSSAIVAGILEAIEDGAHIISMSFGGPAASRAERVAIGMAFNADIVLVASSGNAGRPPVNFPAALREVIAVGATDINDVIADFSSFGFGQELTAPGVDVPSTFLQGEASDALFTVESGFTPTGARQTNPMAFSATGTISNVQMRYVGLGSASEVAAECTISDPCTGQLALIMRGAITFAAKVANAAAAGFAGAVIFNNVPSNFFGTLVTTSAIPAASLSFEDGDPIRAAIQGGAMVFGSLVVATLDYETASGTSFSAPHVAGVAALVRSKNPGLSNIQVRAILDSTAMDLGASGYDFVYGFGRVDAFAAVAATPAP